MSLPKGIAILGSTGSVGRSTLSVIRRLGDTHRVIALAAGCNAGDLLEQIREFRPALASLADADAAGEIREAAAAVGTRLVHGNEGAVEVATATDVGLVVSAIVGAAGLVPTHAAVAAGKDVALANKEVLVVGGAAVRRAADESGAALLPVDSEHNALHQCLRAGKRSEVARLILTASGGPFWERQASSFAAISVAEALDHPVWDMGPKITIDSATMMNKGLEVIEAHWLFDMDPARVAIVVHPGSVVHSLVEFIDGSVVAQMGVPDMQHPIQYALTYPERHRGHVGELDLLSLPPLKFFPPDSERFPCPGLAYRALALGGTAPAALNGANEVLVASFLDGGIGFNDIAAGLAAVLDGVEQDGSGSSEPGLEECLAADRQGRQRAAEGLISPVQRRSEGSLA